MPIPLGILAAAGFRPTAGGSYEHIQTFVVGAGGIASVTFDVSSYSTTYQHLQIRSGARANWSSGNQAGLAMRFNGDTGANYTSHFLSGNGSNVSSFSQVNGTYAYCGSAMGVNTTANAFTGNVTDILDPFEANKRRVIRTLTGAPTFEAAIHSGLWNNTNTVSTITLVTDVGVNFLQGSRFSIYGLKAS